MGCEDRVCGCRVYGVWGCKCMECEFVECGILGAVHEMHYVGCVEWNVYGRRVWCRRGCEEGGCEHQHSATYINCDPIDAMHM